MNSPQVSRRLALGASAAAAAGAIAATFAGSDQARAEPTSDPQVADTHAPSPAPDRILSAYTADPATTRTVVWRTDEATSRGIAQVAKSTDWRQFEESISQTSATTTAVPSLLGYTANYHRSHFSGLRPNTQYVYRVGDGQTWSPWIEFTTSADTRVATDLLFLADAQTDIAAHWSRVVDRAFRTVPNPAAMIHTGDMVDYGDRDDQWGEWAKAIGDRAARTPVLAMPGNHEYWFADGTRGVSPYWRHLFPAPDNGPDAHPDYFGTVYSVDLQGIRLIGLNSAYREAVLNDEVGQGKFLDGQTSWLEQQLDDNRNAWTIVAFHHPTYSTAKDRDNALMRDRWRPLLEKYDVDLVLSGHDHTYGRGYTQASASGRGPLLSGPMYVNSISGPKMYEISGRNWTDNGARLVNSAADTQLFHHIRIDQDRLSFVGYTATGAKFDSFEMVKRGGRRRVV